MQLITTTSQLLYVPTALFNGVPLKPNPFFNYNIGRDKELHYLNLVEEGLLMLTRGLIRTCDSNIIRRHAGEEVDVKTAKQATPGNPLYYFCKPTNKGKTVFNIYLIESDLEILSYRVKYEESDARGIV